MNFNHLIKASDKLVDIPEKHIKHLRSRCTALGFTHPNLSADPDQWVKDIKVMRRKKADSERKFSAIKNSRASYS